MKKLFAMFFLTMTVLFLGMGSYADANVSPSESSIAKSVKSSPIMNSMETVSGQLEYLSGDWYFMDGRYAFSVTGEKFNGCPVVTGYNFVGGTSFGAGIFRVEEASGLRDIPWSTKGEDAHSLLILNGNEVYRRTAKQQYQESIGGVYLGMTAQEVLAKLGAPPVAEKEETRWVYPELGLAVEFETGVAYSIYIINENGRFDGTGLGLFSSDKALQDAYGLQAQDFPEAAGTTYQGFIGKGEKMMILDNPRSICLTIYIY